MDKRPLEPDDAEQRRGAPPTLVYRKAPSSVAN